MAKVNRNQFAYKFIDGVPYGPVKAKNERRQISHGSSADVKYYCLGKVNEEQCMTEMTLVCRTSEGYKDYFKAKNGKHINGCLYCSETFKRITKLKMDPSSLDLNAGLHKLKKFGDGEVPLVQGNVSPDPVESDSECTEDDFKLKKAFRNARSLSEFYMIMKNADLKDSMADGSRIINHIVDDRTFESYRAEKMLLLLPALVIATGGIPSEISKAYYNYNRPVVLLKDPYFSQISHKYIIYALQFPSYKDLKEFYAQSWLNLKNGSVYLVLGEWKKLDNANNGHITYMADINRLGQITLLKRDNNLENLSLVRPECKKTLL